MRFVKQSMRKTPKLSLILLDWSVRESFHLLHYLRRQGMDRDQFEVVFIEYYSRIAEPLKQFADQLDAWILLEMPESCIYHKHLMYNCGLAFAHGDIVVLCDSDAMVKDSFIETIVGQFEERNQIVLHLDQFRNMRRDLHPFNYPRLEEVLGAGCINNLAGKTSGILDRVDPLHSRNYGACMCARRADLIEIGGADEHIDYLGHICGPYEMTLRLVNCGFTEVWHETEYLYHTWHPGQAGVDNYQGPHDGRQMSSTALEALITGRGFPLVENTIIGLIKKGEPLSQMSIKERLIDKRYLTEWDRSNIATRQGDVRANTAKTITDIHRGFKIINDEGHFYARTLLGMHSSKTVDGTGGLTLEGKSVEDLVQKINEFYPFFLRLNERINRFCARLYLLTWAMAAPLIGIIKKIILGHGDHPAERIFLVSRVSGVPRHTRLRRSWEKYRVCWLAIRHYRAYMDNWANHLITNLYFAEPRMLLPIVLTTSRYMQIYVTGLSVFGILPRLKIKRLKESEIQGYFDQLSSGDYPQTLIVARDIYTNYYGLIKACSRSKQVLVF